MATYNQFQKTKDIPKLYVTSTQNVIVYIITKKTSKNESIGLRALGLSLGSSFFASGLIELLCSSSSLCLVEPPV